MDIQVYLHKYIYTYISIHIYIYNSKKWRNLINWLTDAVNSYREGQAEKMRLLQSSLFKGMFLTIGVIIPGDLLIITWIGL